MPFTRARELTLRLDRIACEGHGACTELLPELLSPDEWGYPIVHGTAVPPELGSHARRAVAACPVLALRLERSGG
ncbi:ferredoxin [Streptacidiphilus sp. MAP12-33]|uniref:ferredoxin n=1 Tax=Streptacidiphilus sp. MAP12-33 TaxID=3156266 RepID=UPI0035191EAD